MHLLILLRSVSHAGVQDGIPWSVTHSNCMVVYPKALSFFLSFKIFHSYPHISTPPYYTQVRIVIMIPIFKQLGTLSNTKLTSSHKIVVCSFKMQCNIYNFKFFIIYFQNKNRKGTFSTSIASPKCVESLFKQLQ